ncbi:hypothetical protein OQY15_21410 [Pedobacter sp. MC2016-15]|jgi:hypothetical protein|uniref:hypothetical protein n=1 Tax=Pedobacter sp. MC2016-15 TaxID=2994473 RepID=UPI0022484F47|nr:hypothetical protein [Pedobacter sp. MC2016-15]MCX2481671.1 hypothetical protein [Pedobacter sp. MC2016-15]
MASFTFTPETAQRVKIKVLRKYRELAKENLNFAPGNEDQLVDQLTQLLKRDVRYVEFTINKALADPAGNRL